MYPLSGLPYDSLFDHDAFAVRVNEEGEVSRKLNPHPVKLFKVRDTGHICIVHLKDSSIHLGDEITVLLDFDNNEQVCYAVRISLQAIERRRSDKCILQVRTIVYF